MKRKREIIVYKIKYLSIDLQIWKVVYTQEDLEVDKRGLSAL